MIYEMFSGDDLGEIMLWVVKEEREQEGPILCPQPCWGNPALLVCGLIPF